MNAEQFNRMRSDKGFIAALDQSGGSTPGALAAYGVPEGSYGNEEEMFNLVHAMRTRVATSPAFSGEFILGAILFKGTILREMEGKPTPDYLWENKRVVPFLKVDEGLAAAKNGVRLMKPIPGLDDLLKTAREKRVFGTKMRSVILEANPAGIAEAVAQQFDFGERIARAGFVPILEPEVDIHSPDKAESEKILLSEIEKRLSAAAADLRIMFKLSIPTADNLYGDLMRDPHVVRVVALSGGYDRDEANERLARNKGLVASFSRALLQGLTAGQSDAEFNETLARTIRSIYRASTT